MGFQCWAVKYMGNLVMVHGASSEIRFYEFSGSAYALKFTITTGLSSIYQSNAYDGGKRFMFGGSSQRISTYASDGEPYELQEQFQTGVDIYRLTVDPRQLYFILLLPTPSVEIFFRCP